MCLGFVKGFGSFVAVRALLGVAEGGLLPGMVSWNNDHFDDIDIDFITRSCISHISTKGPSWLCELASFTPPPRSQAPSVAYWRVGSTPSAIGAAWTPGAGFSSS